ncbi:MAG: hypothetical protein JO043_08635 [Candidatus Eremiobacteraeota bacterium]|nr:hypothetical protein [Candidatus Eremiobacteraeota bacterium]
MRRTPPPYRDLSTTLRDLGIAHGDGLAAEELRARVRRALATFQTPGASTVQARRSERQQAIISRCDLGGELHKVVAAHLGISMRTLYRDRIDGFCKLREALTAEPVDAPAGVTRDGIAVRIERAWEQVELGRFREAIVRLEEITASAPPALLCVAFARLAAARDLADDKARGSDALARAKRALSVLGPGAASTVAEAEIAIVEAHRRAAEGAFEDALREYERIAAMLQAHAKYAVDAARLVLRGRIGAHLARGETRAAFELAKAATSDGSPSQTPFAVALAECTLLLGGDAAIVQSDALATYASASASGLQFYAAHALRVAALAAAESMESATALSHLHAALRALADLQPGPLRTSASLELASAFVEMGDGERALQITRTCTAAANQSEFRSGIVRRIEAEALLAIGDRAEASARAAEAVQILSSFQSRRALGEAYFACARTAAARGEMRSARRSASEALRLLPEAVRPARLRAARRLSVPRSMRRRVYPGLRISDVARAG